MIERKISILIPTYGKAEYLFSTLESIFSNSYSNFEILICTQGEFHLDSKLFLSDKIIEIHLEKPSRYLSRIELFKHATGDYVWFVDDDDRITNNSLSFVNNIIQLTQADCLICKKIDVTNDSKRPSCLSKSDRNLENYHFYDKKRALKDLLCTNDYNSVCTKIFKRNIQPSWIHSDIHQSEDKLLNYALYKECNVFVKTDFPIYEYYLSHGNWNGLMTVARLNDSIEARNILIKREPIYAKYLLSDIFHKIEHYLISTEASNFDQDIQFDKEDYDPVILKKVLFSFNLIKYICILKKKYRYFRLRKKAIHIFKKLNSLMKNGLLIESVNKKKYLKLLFPLFCFSIISPITLFSETGRIQDVAYQITNQANQNGFGLVTFGTKDSSSGTRPSFSTEYYTLHDQFNTYSRCIETYDPLKNRNFSIDAYSSSFEGIYKSLKIESLENLSFLTSPGIDVLKTTEEKNGIIADVYRNFIYKFQFKYKGLDKGDPHESHFSIFCAIHQSQANELIEKINSFGEETIDEESLIGKYISVSSSDGQEKFVFRIFNIIKENADYIKDYNEALGNFIFVNDYSFGKLELHNSYMMTKNSYENYYNLKTRMPIYREINFKVIYGNSNNRNTESETIQIELDRLMYKKSTNDAILLSLIFTDFICLLIFCILSLSKKAKKTNFELVFSMFVPLVPYLVTKLISFITKSAIAFSYITSLVFFVLVLFYEIFMVIGLLKLHYESK